MADAISQVDYIPAKHKEPLTVMFANYSKEDEINPLILGENATTQKAGRALQQNRDKYKKMQVENTTYCEISCTQISTT